MGQFADKLIVHYQKIQQGASGDLVILEKKITEIKGKIDNIVNAIAGGLYNSSMKATMDKLDQWKAEVSSIISETRSKLLYTSRPRYDHQVPPERHGGFK